MKVLFLDIDGVLNSRAYVYRMRAKDKKYRLWLDVDPIAVELLRRIIKETDCKVVLSSTWRLYKDSRDMVRDKVVRYIDCTADLQRGSKRGIVPRGEEVDLWLKQHPEVTHYAILDDDSDFLPNQWLFKTTFDTGLTEDITQAVIDHLGAPDRTRLYA